MKTRARLVRDEEQATVLRRMREMCVAEGLSTAAIARRLNGEGIPSPRGVRWSETGVNNALTCPAHAGLIKNVDGEWIPGVHWDERIWEPEDLEAIKASIRSRVRRFEAVAEDQPDAFLLGIAKCARCGAPLRWATDQASRYRCTGDRTAQDRESHLFVSSDLLIAGVLSHIESLSLQPEVLAGAESRIREAVEQGLEPVHTEMDAARREADALWNRREKLIDALESGTVAKDLVGERLRRLEVDRSAALERMRSYQARLDASGEQERLCQRAIERLRDFPAMWERLSVYERRDLMTMSVESLTVGCEEGRILARLKLVAMDEVEIPILRGRKRWNGGVLEGPEGLSVRRLAVLHHYSIGRSDIETAAVMVISISQVTKALRDMRRHLGVATNHEALELCRETIERNLSVLPLYGEANRRRDKRTLRLMEWQALERAARGDSAEEIAESYNVPISLVEGKLASAYEKIGETDPVRALTLARERDLLPREKWETGTRKTERKGRGKRL